jgi:hypothetical protein
VMYFADDGSCSWAGLGTVSNHNPAAGGWAMINGLARLDVMGHELGHNEGLGHSSLEWCTSGGVRNSDGPGCTRRDYADPYDVMGIAWGTTGQLNAAQRDAIGLLPSGGISTVNGAARVTLAPLEGTTGLRSVRLVDGSARYWLEYRTAVGRDSWIDNANLYYYSAPGSGIVVHRADGLANWGEDTQLVDTSPQGSSLGLAALKAGGTWTAASGHLHIAVVSTSSGAAVLDVTRP